MFTKRWLWVCLLMLFPMDASATMVEAMEIETMADKASEVVRGAVKTIEVKRQEGRIETHITVKIEKAWKGRVPATEEIVVVVPGGQIGNLAQTAAGTPTMEVKDRVVLFLWRPAAAPVHPFRLLGLSQGHFRVVDDRGVNMAVSDRRELTRVTRKTGEESHGTELRLPLKELELRLGRALSYPQVPQDEAP